MLTVAPQGWLNRIQVTKSCRGLWWLFLSHPVEELAMDKVSNTRDLIIAALQAESLRQKAIASNVANMETPGYRRVDVKFEEMLAQKMDDNGGKVDVSTIKPEMYQPRNTTVKSNGNDVSWEGEVAAMVKNSIRHKTLMRLLIKKVNGIDKIINTP
jgi:flagellar basal-body rod protein FlgB